MIGKLKNSVVVAGLLLIPLSVFIGFQYSSGAKVHLVGAPLHPESPLVEGALPQIPPTKEQIEAGSRSLKLWKTLSKSQRYEHAKNIVISKVLWNLKRDQAREILGEPDAELDYGSGRLAWYFDAPKTNYPDNRMWLEISEHMDGWDDANDNGIWSSQVIFATFDFARHIRKELRQGSHKV